MNRCNHRKIAAFDALSSKKGTFGTLNACQINLNGGVVVAVQGPFLIDALAVFNAGAAGVNITTNTTGKTLLIQYVESEVVTDITGVVPQSVNYMTTSLHI